MQPPDPQMLAQILAIVALLAAIIEYIQIVHRRVAARELEAERRLSADTGLRGLVRVFLADHTRQAVGGGSARSGWPPPAPSRR